MSKRSVKEKKKAHAAKPAKKINSRRKGASGERELAHFLTDHGLVAIRGQQHAGGVDSPDVICTVPSFPFHVEGKRVEAGSLYNWLAQAQRDAGNKIPLVAHRRNDRRWVAILFLDDFLNFVVQS
jgi:Holliday junction resolvase